MFYKLDGRDVVKVPDDEWRGVPKEYRRVARDDINGVTVSTLFLGIDHGIIGAPVVFETMVFGGEHDEAKERYSTYDEAEAGHARWVEKVTK